MEEVLISANRRDVIGKHSKKLRREGKLPAVMYGHQIEPIPIVLDYRDASRILSSVGLSQLLTMELDGEKYPVLVRDRQIDFIKGNLLHVDFLAVSMEEKISTSISVVVEGEAPATSDYSAVVVTGANELTIECLPGNLPDRITIDVSNLIEIGDAIYVRDLDMGEDIDILDDPDTMLVVITPVEMVPEEEEEEEELLEEYELEEPELVEHGRREDEEDEKE